MRIKEKSTGKWYAVIIEPVSPKDYIRITKKRYFFNWKTEKKQLVYKLRRADSDDILGLLSFDKNLKKEWIEIRLLAVVIENRGTKKQYEGIAENLMAFAAREAIKYFKHDACIALVPKTDLIHHYKRKYKMISAGKRLALFGNELLALTQKYT